MEFPAEWHGQFFRVIERDGRRALKPHWRDTVLIHPKETVDVAMFPRDLGAWMLHCHIQEHAESGMMTLVGVERVDAGAVRPRSAMSQATAEGEHALSKVSAAGSSNGRCDSARSRCSHPGGYAPMSLEPQVAWSNLVNAPSSSCANRARVTPLNAAASGSNLMSKLTGEELCGGGVMPPGGRLPDEDIATIRAWIQQGALDN